MNRRPSFQMRAALLLGTATFSCTLLTSCSDSEAAETSGSEPVAEASAEPGSTDSGDISEAQLESGVPAECLEAFPVAFGEPDLAAATLLPADFPAEAVDGTLCQTAATGSGVQVVDWATDASGAEVLDALETALPSSYSVTREDKGMGEQLDGTAGDVYFTVVTRPGAWTLQLGPA
ncbi:hypothetical protein L2K70_17260 [Nocardioides KLBMP 9356]|uniref:Lipoprotein n=1 Tax=Nocardioides potassii TaxID=2911371 RepID=A0ABS9HFY9_9ACTN|nr:hypothetical protein [Nocardioides potassii]MCF6379364.1 hypothetical protein [Nocardioides potassii]